MIVVKIFLNLSFLKKVYLYVHALDFRDFRHTFRLSACLSKVEIFRQGKNQFRLPTLVSISIWTNHNGENKTNIYRLSPFINRLFNLNACNIN